MLKSYSMKAGVEVERKTVSQALERVAREAVLSGRSQILVSARWKE